MQKRKLIGFCLRDGGFVHWAMNLPGAQGESPFTAGGETGNRTSRNASSNQAQSSLPDPVYLVREVVYNELHDHDTHGYWRYWIERHSSKQTQIEEAVETPDGPVARLELSDGRPLTADLRAQEDRRLEHLIDSPSEQAQHRKEYSEDEHRIGRILALLPNAFLYEPA